jgi:acetyltransferase-like isoleucine patch superfamily enzyme
LKLILRKIYNLLNANPKILGDKSLVKIDRSVAFKGRVIIDVTKGGSVTIGRRSVLDEGAIISTFGGHISIGENCSFNSYCVIYGHGNLSIGSNVRVATHTVIIPANHKYDDINIPIYKQGMRKKGIKIKDNVWIGAGCKILDGVTIGSGSIIAAGSVVNKDLGSNCIYGGVPVKLLKRRK